MSHRLQRLPKRPIRSSSRPHIQTLHCNARPIDTILHSSYTTRNAGPDTSFPQSFFHTPACLIRDAALHARRPIFQHPTYAFHKSNKRSFSISAPRPSTPRFSFKVAASYCGKGQKPDFERNVFRYSPFTRIQPMPIETRGSPRQKRRQRASGQDAFFVSRVGETLSMAFGVADGVGGWSDQGIDSADFAHGLCNYMADVAHDFPNGTSQEYLTARDLLSEGFARVCLDERISGGGSTACVAIGRPDGTMEVANLGDSGFIQLRLNAVHHYSNPQTHAFNTPYQLSRVPPRILAQIAHFGGPIPFCDMPSDAGVTRHTVRHGDVLIFATDGVWDNLSPHDTLTIVSRTMADTGAWHHDEQSGVIVGDNLATLTKSNVDGSASAKDGETSAATDIQTTLAVTIMREAKAASLNTKVDGPFAKAVQKQYPEENYHGGKVDDICVVVGIVVEARGS